MDSVEIAYQASLDYIYSFIDYSLKRNLRNAEAKFKLDRMIKFMSLLGNPQNRFKVIHVAGTKGKGSVCSFCASALRSAGYKVGLYTSPHMQEFTERIQVDGEEIDHLSVVRLVETMKKVVPQVPEITTFELTTALGFLYFAEKKIDVAVLEVGLGGRLDATNIVSPLVSVITSISFDHMAVLGNTLSKIAFEKGGIIKPGKPVVISPQKDEAQNRLLALCEERNSPAVIVGKDLSFTSLSYSLEGQTLEVTPRFNIPVGINEESIEPSSTQLIIPLLGYHQVINAATAYAAIKTATFFGLEVSDSAIQKGFAETKWLGRFEILHLDPAIVVDSAHNTDSAERLVQALDDYFPGLPVTLVFGVSADKDVKSIIKALSPRVNKVITSQSIHPRAMDAIEIMDHFKDTNLPVKAIVPIEDAIQTAVDEAESNTLILITGSVFVAAAGRAVWPQIRINRGISLVS